MKIALPAPDAAAQIHSDTLAQMLRGDIAANGPMPFSRWMERCLYTPGLGYYSAGMIKFGAAGDFITAPESGPLFAQCMGRAVAALFRGLGKESRFVELGGGSGAFVVDVLHELQFLDAVPGEYAILEPSADLRERQRERVRAELPTALGARVRWLDTPPEDSWQGVMFANEVIDALPATRFTLRDGEVWEEHVTLEGDRFVRVDRPADALVCAAVRHLERTLGRTFADGYRSELLPQLPYWLQAIAGNLERGLAMFVDYGYTRRDYYSAERVDGTLACHYRHRLHGDALILPGLQDITASVDFTALAEAGISAGLDLAAYTDQAQFLIGNGLADLHQRAAGDADALALYRLSAEIRRLTMPDQMGERFQTMVFSRGIDAALLLDLADAGRSAGL